MSIEHGGVRRWRMSCGSLPATQRLLCASEACVNGGIFFVPPTLCVAAACSAAPPQIRGYPTLKVYHAGAVQGEAYKGEGVGGWWAGVGARFMIQDLACNSKHSVIEREHIHAVL